MAQDLRTAERKGQGPTSTRPILKCPGRQDGMQQPALPPAPKRRFLFGAPEQHGASGSGAGSSGSGPEIMGCSEVERVGSTAGFS